MRWALEQDCTTFVDGLFLFLLRDPRFVTRTANKQTGLSDDVLEHEGEFTPYKAVNPGILASILAGNCRLILLAPK